MMWKAIATYIVVLLSLTGTPNLTAAASTTNIPIQRSFDPSLSGWFVSPANLVVVKNDSKVGAYASMLNDANTTISMMTSFRVPTGNSFMLRWIDSGKLQPAGFQSYSVTLEDINTSSASVLFFARNGSWPWTNHNVSLTTNLSGHVITLAFTKTQQQGEAMANVSSVQVIQAPSSSPGQGLPEALQSFYQRIIQYYQPIEPVLTVALLLALVLVFSRLSHLKAKVDRIWSVVSVRGA